MTVSEHRKKALMGLKALSMRQMRSNEAFWATEGSGDCLLDGKPVLFWVIDQANKARQSRDAEMRHKTLSILTWLLKQGVNTEISHKGNTVLMEVAILGDRACARRLIKAGAQVNATSRLGNTSLHWASMAGEPGMCRLLLENGAQLEVFNQQRQTPLHCAADHVRLGTITVLHEAGASWEALDVHGRTPLQMLGHRDPKAVSVWANRPERDKLERATATSFPLPSTRKSPRL